MTYKQYLLHQLSEMRRELLAALEGVSEEDLFSFEPCDHWPVGWIAEHCTQVADRFLWRSVKGESFHSYEEHVNRWTKIEPKPGDAYPAPAEIAIRWADLCDAVTGVVDGFSEQDLQKSYGTETYVTSILRVVNHTNSHLRGLWCILGERRVDHKFAEQQTWLA